MRVGVFGGTFDPVHNGHIAAAAAAVNAANLDEVIFVPVGQPGHRTAPVASAADRLEMTRIAIAAVESAPAAYFVSDIDVNRDGPTYTVNTLRDLHEERPTDELFFILGADAFEELGAWRSPEDICTLASFIVVSREPQPRTPRTAASPVTLHTRVISASLQGHDVSATNIRARCMCGETIEALVPAEVADYIRNHRVYQS